MQSFEAFTFSTRGLPGPNQKFARHISNLLIPAVTKAAIDLWIATAPLGTVSYGDPPPPGTSLKINPYEVTIVQNLFQLLSADPQSATPVWEAGFKATQAAGRPTSIDIVLEGPQSTADSKVALLEFGADAGKKPKFDAKKISEDLSKLANLTRHGNPVSGLKQMFYVTVARSQATDTWAKFKTSARKASPAHYLGARRFPIYAPDGWRYATIAVYE
jgi:hypothetical protein